MSDSKQKTQYQWHQSYSGEGGYITGLLQNFLQPDTLYARCDVAGIYKSIDGGKSWRTINNCMKESYHHSVQSFAMSPHNPEILFRCSGEARGGYRYGNIHKSMDGGESWKVVCRSVDYYGNGPTRIFGEVIAVDPFNRNCVITGGYSSGIWISRDEGETWEYSALLGERFTCIAFHPKVKGRVYAGTVSDEGMLWVKGDAEVQNKLLKELQDYRREFQGRLYCSEDGGSSWTLLSEGFDVADIVFGNDSCTIICAAMDKGIIRSTDGGKSWKKAGKGLPENISYNTIATDPHQPDVFYTVPDLRGRHIHLDPIAIYRSEDGCDSWELAEAHTEKDIYDYPSYVTARSVGWAISKIKIDVNNPQKMYTTNWFGVSQSLDRGKTWTGNFYRGTETTCIESVVCQPQGGKIYFTLADHAPYVSCDDGKSYRQCRHLSGYNSSTALLISRENENLVIAGFRDREDNPIACIAKLHDNGETVEVVKKLNKGLFVQAFAEDYHAKGTFYAYVEGDIDNGAGLYKSSDWGNSWSKATLSLPGYITSLPYDRQWIENELLSVVVYQTKNACGVNRHLCTDPHKEKTLYLGEWTEGFFVTEDGGNSWRNISHGFPFKNNRASVLSVIKADAEKAGVLYAGFIREGLWRSLDYGKTWCKLYPLDDSICNVSALVIGGKSQEELFIACEPLTWSTCESAVYYSSDWGNTWCDIYDKSLGAVRWKGMGVDKETGTIHLGSCGNGCFYAVRRE